MLPASTGLVRARGRRSKAISFGGVMAAAAAVGSVFAASPALAANTLDIAGTAQATSDSGGGSIVTGDSFSWSFTVDQDSVTTKLPWTGDTFNNAVTAFTVTADSSNKGSWSPAGSNWVMSPVNNLVTNPGGDQLTLQIKATNAPQIDGVDFYDLGITLDWNPTVVDIQPVSGTPTLGATLGTFSPDLAAAKYYFQLREKAIQDQYPSDSATFVASAAQTSAGSSSATSSSAASSSDAQVPQRFDLSLTASGGLDCGTPSVRTQGAWVQLPAADRCTPPSDRAGSTLLGWSTNSAFPVDKARDQVAKGWGAIDTVIDGQRMIFIPAGGYAFLSGDNRLHAIWG